MNILVVNCGSSSLKYQLMKINPESDTLLAKGLIEKIGLEEQIFTHKTDKTAIKKQKIIALTHKDAVKKLLDTLVADEEKGGVIKKLDEIKAVGHRVVHGGEKFSDSALITDEVMKSIEECFDLAPLHNPANTIGIQACKELLPNAPQVAVFDTAFHQNMPKEAYLYAIPYEYYKKYGIRRYGFHGTSHRYVAEKTAEKLGKDLKDAKIITCHLGNGSSMAAVKNGHSIDTTMGLTPLEGLVMGTRCGDIDPAIVFYLMKKENLTPKEADRVFNKKSGVLGLSGLSSDMRDIENAYLKNDEIGELTYKVYTNRIKKYIGAYMAEMGGCDAVVFTAGVGENDYFVRQFSCEGLEDLGIKIDKEKNKELNHKEGEISTEDSKVKVFIIPTNEEFVIACDTMKIVNELEKK